MVVLHRDEGGLQAFDQSNLAPFSNSPCNGAVMFAKPLKTCGTTTTAPSTAAGSCRLLHSAQETKSRTASASFQYTPARFHLEGFNQRRQ
ncbi:hypothetical protein T03_9989 [Trichinella britovi]|uniref:Uncharacterized protein n=1 Tax=Trichinella britovi TaxID=45882 RepID=A0A0V1CRE2_TRIBR|nr:hypothetical protein T03_9989 [Trichinella britovi]